MTYPGPDGPSTPGEQPSGATAAPQPPAAAPAEKTGLKKWLPIAGPVVVAGVVASWLTGGFGPGEPEVVDCDADGAEFKIVGIQDGKQTYQDFEKDENSCSEFPKWEVALWSGEMTEEGTVYCAEGL